MNTVSVNTIANEVFPTALLKQAGLWENATKETIQWCVQLLANQYGFDYDEAIRHIQLDELKIEYKKPSKKVVREKKEKVVKEKKEKVVKEKKTLIPLPFLKHCMKPDNCYGLCFNKGLFTQCENQKLEDTVYCSKCSNEASQSSNNLPKCGSVLDRVSKGLYEFVDPNGRKPTHFLKIINKMNVTVEQVEEYMTTLNLTFDDEHIIHIVEPEQPAKKRKAAAKKPVVVAAEVDMFSAMPSIVVEEQELVVEDDSVMPVPVPVISKKKSLSVEEKEALKAQKLAEKEALKAQKLAEKEALKAQKLAEKEALKAQKLAEKEKKEALKAQKLAEKAEKAEKKALKTEKKNKKDVEAVVTVNSQELVEELVTADLDELDLDDLVDESEEEEMEEESEEFEYQNVTYLIQAGHSKLDEFTVYNMESEEIGVYSNATGVLTFKGEDDEY